MSEAAYRLLARITIGANEYPSYASVEHADAYFGGRLHAETWSGATIEQKQKSLVMASRVLDTTYQWVGQRCNNNEQLLEWPREIAYLDQFTDRFFDVCDIPREIRDATSELGMSLLATDRTAVTDVPSGGIDKISVGSISLEFTEQNTGSDAAQRPQVVADYIDDMVNEFVAQSLNVGAFGEVDLVRT